jgi:hypothetical protein
VTAPKRVPSNRDPVALATTAAIFRTALARLERQQQLEETSDLKAAS